MRRLTSSSREEASAEGSIEVSGTAAVTPNRCYRFRPALFQVGERFGRFVEAPIRRFGDAELENPHHASRDVLARQLQALHGLAERLFHHRAAPIPAPAQRAIQKGK